MFGRLGLYDPPEEAEMKHSEKGFTLIELLIVVAIIGIIAAIAIPNLLNAIDRGKQKRTMADMRSLGTAVESYAVDNNVYPQVTDAATLKSVVEAGAYMKNMPTTDGWSNTFQVASATTQYTIYSFGKDNSGTSCVSGTTNTFDDQICFINGQFLRYPAGSQQ
jgi:general secretion pathway protein G